MLSNLLWSFLENVGKPPSSIYGLWSSCSEDLSLCSPPTPFVEPVEFEDSSLSPCFQESACSVFSWRLTWQYSLGSWPGLLRTGFPEPVWPHSFSSTLHRLTGSLRSCGGLFLVLNGLWITRFVGLAIAGIVGFGFAIVEPSLEVASCPNFDVALCSMVGSERKLLKWLQEEIEKFIMLHKRTKWFHSSRVQLPFVSANWFLIST